MTQKKFENQLPIQKISADDSSENKNEPLKLTTPFANMISSSTATFNMLDDGAQGADFLSDLI